MPEVAGGEAETAQPLVAAHLASCAACSAAAAAVTECLAALRTDVLPEPPHLPSPDLSFLAPIPAPGPWWTRLLARWGVPFVGGSMGERRALAGGAAALAVLGILLLAVWVGAPGRSPRQSYLPPVGATVPAIVSGATTTAPAAAATTTPRATVGAASATVAQPGGTPAAGGSLATPALATSTAPVGPELTASPPRRGEPTVAVAPPAIVLGEPTLLPGGNGLLQFGWSAPPLVGDTVFDVRVCRGADCRPGAGLTNVREPSWVWCPNQGAGAYRWQVALIDGETKEPAGPESAVGAFGWPGGSCAVTPEVPPSATPDYTPTPGPEP